MDSVLSYRRYRLPFTAPVRTAHGIWKEREGIYLRLEGDSGAVTYAEVSPVPGFGPETVDRDEAVLAKIGSAPTETLLAAVPTELGALRRGLALVSGESFQPKAESVGVAALLPSGRACLEAAAPKAEIGFRVFKWKVGVIDPKDERSILDDLLARLPEGSKVRLDANGAWNQKVAEAWFDFASGRPVEFIEQPVDAASAKADDILLGLAADYPTPAALDESLVGDSDIERWLDRGWPGYFVIKPALVGDLTGALKRLEAAKASVVFSSALETALGAQAALAAALSWKGKSAALGFGVWPLFADARWNGPHAAPFLRWSDVTRTVGEELWTALT